MTGSRYGAHQLAFFDVETAGFRPQDGLLEVGCVLTDITSHTVLGEFGVKVLPPEGKRISQKIARINGYDEKVWAREALEVEACLVQFKTFVGGKPTLLVGHGIGFDWKFLSEGAREMAWRTSEVEGLIDTLAMARQVAGLGKHSLSHLCATWGIGGLDFHRALEDARAARLVYQAMRRLGVKPKVETAVQWWGNQG